METPPEKDTSPQGKLRSWLLSELRDLLQYGGSYVIPPMLEKLTRESFSVLRSAVSVSPTDAATSGTDSDT
jgi:hypothetical protein